ncbi:MAG: MraY family glycosyltransferase [Lentisphaeria bacterium]|nr:MraY family glycosyltransferase [Lentisphaeria bacterium]
MNNWWIIYGFILLVSLVLAAGFSWGWRRFALNIGFTDKPASEGHKRHEKVTPVAGGVGMIGAWLLTLVSGFFGAMLLKSHLSGEMTEQTANLAEMLPRLGVIVGGALLLGLVGLADDRKAMSAKVKFSAQFAVAAFVALYGVRIELFISYPVITWGLTVFWILFIVNAVNFFDNMDGLAGGVAAIASFTFLLVAGFRGQYYVAALSASVCGVCVGFLIFNWPPASLFMGDCGSHFLGFILAVLGAMTTFYVTGETPTYAPLAIPLLVLALPIFDTFAVVIIRLLLREPVYVGDHRHISHRFTQLGLSRRCSVILIHLLGLTISAGALTLLWLPPLGALAVFCQVFFLFTLISILHIKGKKDV